MLDMKKYTSLARQIAAEGIVLLRNEQNVLPLQKGCKVAFFGRSQLNYVKSGTGSGGMVNTEYVVSILDALECNENICLNQAVKNAYVSWVKEHEFDNGTGWATEPWCQEEMPLEEDFVKKARKESEVAIIVVARTAGEDKDNSATRGSYLLTKVEERMLELVCKHFEKTVVLLNVGNVIDMKWVKTYQPSAVLYVWQGGQEGGNAVVDVLTGAVNPSGKLADTVALDIADYPSTKNFGGGDVNVYEEDIYVGYRYFETVAKEKVLYPFGFGLSYTTFDKKVCTFLWKPNGVFIEVDVTNLGIRAGKEVVQVYVNAPQGKLGKPSRILCGFAKTKELAAGQTQRLAIFCDRYYFSSYDDSGVSGYPSAYVLEEGTYTFYIGNGVRCETKAGRYAVKETILVEQLSKAVSPVTQFKRMHPVETETGFLMEYEDVPLRTYNLKERINENRPEDIAYTGDKGYKLKDVKLGKVTMEQFMAQLSNEQLCTLLRGEGMNSPKVTAGTGGAIGGLSPSLREFGIPIACCTDGPSGLRMDSGAIAFSIPNGTCLACSFNEALSTELFECLGLEMRKNNIDILLGPGLNLHRNPLNGRNFEYFSEDPLVAGRMATAQLRGLHRQGVTGTIKHFIANSQEHRRHFVSARVSERAIRELYLKSFEIACKEGGAYTIMSSYNPVNEIWTSSHYDLLTHILRKEWGYQGLVMTDWWAKGNEEGEEGSPQQTAPMVRSQNDLYMVVVDAEANSNNDNTLESIGTEKLKLGEVQRNAMNVLKVIMRLPVMDKNMNY